MSLFELCEWLGNTSWSIALHESRYAFLVVLTIHVLTLSVFVGTALMIDLRLLGVTMMRVPASQVIGRLVPWTAAGLILMTTQVRSCSMRHLSSGTENVFFRMKMAALVLAL